MGRLIAVAVAAAAAGACRHDTCLEGKCPAPCAQLAFTCAAKPMYAGRAADAPVAYRLLHGNAADDDTLISNGIVTAVISAPGNANDLAPTGGNLIDFGPAGGVDDLTITYQLSGILPDDAFAYTSISIEKDAVEQGDVVRVTVRGTLDGRRQVPVVTQYELGPCDPGLRVRSELFNGTADTHAWMIADTSHWGKRRVVPFSPARGQGYVLPELSLIELADLWVPYDYASGATPAAESGAYGAVACDGGSLSGVNDLEISALGSPMTLVEPGETLALERFLVAAGAGAGPAPAIDAVLAARAQLGGGATSTVSGRVVAGGMPFGGDVRRASIVVRVDGRPVSAVVPAADGTFAATVPAGGAAELEVWSFGREVARVAAGGGDVEVPLPATLQVSVTERATPIYAIVALHPADEATRAAVTGTFHGSGLACAPWLGPPQNGSPACNRAIVDPQGTELEVPPGKYRVYATAGPEHTLAVAEVELVAGEVTPVALALQKLDIVPAGWLTADLHVHGRASFDSGFPDEDRVKTFAAAGVQVIAATDHDVIGDYSETVRALGLDGRIAVMGGLEATQLIPWLDVPGEDVPRVIGHFNFWPLQRVPGSPRAGAPSDERMEPGTLFDRMAPLVGDGGVMMLNHPWDEPLFGRDLGYLRAIKFDPRRAIVEGDPANGALLRRPSGQHRNADWNLIEILNGADQTEMQKGRVLWASLLAQGFIAAGAGNSDSHSLSDAQLGWARNWVDAGTTVAAFDARKFDDAVRDGRMVAGNGVIVLVEIGQVGGRRRGLGLTPYVPVAGDSVFVTVLAPPWVPVDEVRLVTSKGTEVLASGGELMQPPDPFGTAGTVRYRASFALAGKFAADDFFFVEAGLRYPLAADLDDDGVPDTTDNNGDGVVDAADVEPDEDTGPIQAPPDPTDPAHPRFLVTRVVPGAYPEGFANPILIDVDGNGWTPPGLPAARKRPAAAPRGRAR
ncbi:MAG: PHP domain-containing protein [Deltaproteobacteria bacterium]|nr:PHP domain-containing protein [Deltaproteobacteria bacterium]